MAKVNPVPPGYQAVPVLVVRGGSEAIAWYTKVFGAREVSRMTGPGGAIMHAELRIGGNVVMLCDEMPFPGGAKAPQAYGGSPQSIMHYCEDVDATFHRALQQGAQSEMHPADMFWGDRFGRITDPFGHGWSLAMHIEDVAPAEMEKRKNALFGGAAA